MRTAGRLSAIVLSTSLAAVGLLGATSVGAGAAAGSPFDPNTPQILASKSASSSDPTGLYRLSPNSAGTYSFTQLGSDANLVYNALTFSTVDDYLYAISGDPKTSGVPSGSLLKIGSNGGYEVVGSGVFQEVGKQTNMAAFDPTTKEMWALSAQGSTLYRINLDPTSAGYGTSVGTVTLDTPDHNAQGGGSDMTYADGAFWTLGKNGLFRIKKDGSTAHWAVPSGAGSSTADDQAGAAWTFLNGDLGFSYNGSGEVVRIKVADATSATPTFTTVVKSGGAASGQNDGAAIAGTVDLAIDKTGQIVDDGDSVSYTLTVTNNGGAPSSGWTVSDDVPAGFSNVAASGDGTASVSGNTVTVTGSSLAVGATATITITATSPDPRPTSVKNTASVTGADPDPVPGNNEDSVTLTFPTDPTDPGNGTGGEPTGSGDPVLPETGAPASGNGNLWLEVGGGALVAAGLATVAVAARRRRVSQ